MVPLSVEDRGGGPWRERGVFSYLRGKYKRHQIRHIELNYARIRGYWVDEVAMTRVDEE
jgi:hypothetical protein